MHLNKRLLKFFFVSNHIKKCSSAISLQGREKSVRKSSIRAGNGATEFVQGYLSTSLSAQHQIIILRGDSGFATPDLMETLEGNNIFYTIRLKSNPR
ncbi:transposase, partial [Weissella confusa]|uniref:transposase n=1 Tax=Weissella confusa TaxID=1583 RepID=UPI00223B1B22